MSRLVYVYTLSDPSSGAIRYVGCTTDPARRYAVHCRSLSGGVALDAWHEDLRTRGARPVMRIVATTVPEHADEVERWYITRFSQSGCALLNVRHNARREPLAARVDAWKRACRAVRRA